MMKVLIGTFIVFSCVTGSPAVYGGGQIRK